MISTDDGRNSTETSSLHAVSVHIKQSQWPDKCQIRDKSLMFCNTNKRVNQGTFKLECQAKMKGNGSPIRSGEHIGVSNFILSVICVLCIDT